MDKKTKCLQLRLTKKEAEKLKDMAKDHDSVSQYILCAVKEFSNVDPRLRLDILNILAKNHKKCWNELSWASGNISQTVKRANELVEAGKLSSYYLENVIRPEANKTMDTINEIKKELEVASCKAMKLGLWKVRRTL